MASADIKRFGRACLFAMLLLIALHFFTPQVFLFSISLLFVNKYHYFIEVYFYYADATLKLNFEKLNPAIFITFTTE